MIWDQNSKVFLNNTSVSFLSNEVEESPNNQERLNAKFVSINSLYYLGQK